MKIHLLKSVSFCLLLAGHVIPHTHAQESVNQRKSNPFTEDEVMGEALRLDEVRFSQEDFRGFPISAARTDGFTGIFWTKGSREYYLQGNESGLKMYGTEAGNYVVLSTGRLEWDEDTQFFRARGSQRFHDPSGVCPPHYSDATIEVYVVNKSQHAWAGALSSIKVETTMHDVRHPSCELRNPRTTSLTYARNFDRAEWEALMELARFRAVQFESDMRSLMARMSRYEEERLTQKAKGIITNLRANAHPEVLKKEEANIKENERFLHGLARFGREGRSAMNNIAASYLMRVDKLLDILRAGSGDFKSQEVKVTKYGNIPSILQAEANDLWFNMKIAKISLEEAEEGIAYVDKRVNKNIQIIIDRLKSIELASDTLREEELKALRTAAQTPTKAEVTKNSGS